MTTVPVCLVGCGGMGSRHVQGFARLQRSGLSNVRLVAVCDVRQDNAERVAGEAEKLLGYRPKIHLAIDDAVADPEIAAFDVVTEAFSHLAVVLPALRAGKHVLCEKPLALTVRSCQALIDAAKAGGAVLATAENYRRDPTNRLAKAVIDSGVLGPVHLMVQTMIGGNDRIIITPWRHFKDKGAIGLDMGAHLTDIVQYYFGPFQAAFGKGFIAEPIRRRQEKPEMQTEAYLKRFLEIPEQITATGEDSFAATFTMQSGLMVQMAFVASGPGKGYNQRTVHGQRGSLEIFNDRTGKAPILHTAEGDLIGQALADKVGFQLDALTQKLYGGVSYELDWAETDSGLLAIEIHDFAAAIMEGRPPEVDGEGGLTAVASVLAAYESGLAGRAVTMDEVLSSTVSTYQDDIDADLGLLPKSNARLREDRMTDAAFAAVPLIVQKLGPKQIAFVVRDLEAATRQWWDLLGIGPWTAWEYTPEILKDMTYKGAPAQFGLKHALAWKDGVQFELVEPTTGPSFFADQLASSGEGLNHIGIHVMENHAQAVAELEAAGFTRLQSARGFGGDGSGAFVYFTSPKLNGLVLELISPPATRRTPLFVYPLPEEAK